MTFMENKSFIIVSGAISSIWHSFIILFSLFEKSKLKIISNLFLSFICGKFGGMQVISLGAAWEITLACSPSFTQSGWWSHLNFLPTLYNNLFRKLPQMTGLNCVFSLFVTVMNRSSRKRDRFTVRPSDYISDSVTAPSSTATACFLSLSHSHAHRKNVPVGWTAWLWTCWVGEAGLHPCWAEVG